jgi:isoleucyl-tRNA synthetase
VFVALRNYVPRNIEFDELSTIDKLFLTEVVEFSNELSKQLDKEIDIATYQQTLLDFVQDRISNFYIDFSQRTGSYQILAETL